MKIAKLFSLNCLAIACIWLALPALETAKEITLTAEITGCGNTLHLYQFDGFGFSLIESAKSKDQIFSFTIPESTPRFYYVGPSERKAAPIILGEEKAVSIKANCSQLRAMEFVDSPINEGYKELKAKIEGFNRQNSMLMRSIQGAQNDDNKREELLQQLKELDENRLSFLTDLKKENPLFGSIVSLNTYLSFPHNGQEYDNEVGYYAERFFQFADFEQEVYSQIPWTYESFKGYTTTLSSVGLPDDMHKLYLEKALALTPEASATQKLAYAGLLAALKQKQHANYIHFVDLFVESYQKIDPKTTAQLKKELVDTRNLMVGGTAPDFSQETPEGEILNLSDLRGKVVLIDFWASWCGPCRRENPNVVRVYEKYQEKGFEILSVSLDKQKDRWLQAIKKDGMVWHHVSDLKGWQNEVAQAYGIHAIPHTILLDSEGKILARNLRGPNLEEKLAQLFGQ